MLHCANASLSMTNWWMLHFIQHDKTEDVIPSVSEESTHGCFTSLSMTRAVSFRTLFFVIPSASEESSMDASLRSA